MKKSIPKLRVDPEGDPIPTRKCDTHFGVSMSYYWERRLDEGLEIIVNG